MIKLGYPLDRHLAALAADLVFEPLGEPPAVGKPGESFLSHGLALMAEDTAALEFEIDPHISAGFVANKTPSAVIMSRLNMPAMAADAFF